MSLVPTLFLSILVPQFYISPIVAADYVDHVSSGTDGFFLYTGDRIFSSNGNERFEMQSDGNFVLQTFSGSWGPTWATDTNPNPTAYVAVQSDGNIVIYPSVGSSSIWASNSYQDYSTGPYFLVVSDDGYAYLLNKTNQKIWNTPTAPNIVPTLSPSTISAAARTYSLIWYDDMETNAGNWSIKNDADIPYSSTNCNSGNCARAIVGSSGDDSYIERSTNIADYSDIQLQLYIKESQLEAGDYCQIWYRYDAGSYTKWDNYGDGTAGFVKINLPSSPTSTLLWIQFKINADGGSNNDKCFFDDVYLRGIPITANPTTIPTENPTNNPTPAPTNDPTPSPTNDPTPAPTTNPTPSPTANPTPAPTNNPTISPTPAPTDNPTTPPTPAPTNNPTPSPTANPTKSVTKTTAFSTNSTVVTKSALTTTEMRLILGITGGTTTTKTSVNYNNHDGSHETKAEDNSTMESWMYVVITCATICCCLTVLLICIKRKKKSRKVSVETPGNDKVHRAHLENVASGSHMKQENNAEDNIADYNNSNQSEQKSANNIIDVLMVTTAGEDDNNRNSEIELNAMKEGDNGTNRDEFVIDGSDDNDQDFMTKGVNNDVNHDDNDDDDEIMNDIMLTPGNDNEEVVSDQNTGIMHHIDTLQ